MATKDSGKRWYRVQLEPVIVTEVWAFDSNQAIQQAQSWFTFAMEQEDMEVVSYFCAKVRELACDTSV